MLKALVLGVVGAFMLASGGAFAEGNCAYSGHKSATKEQPQQTVVTNQSVAKPAVPTPKDTKG